MLEKLKNLQVDRLLSMEEAVALSAYARSLEGEYEALEVVAPEWLDQSSTVLREEIAVRVRAADMEALRKLEGELEGYKTVSEKRTEAQRKLAKLQAKLGMSARA